MSGHNPHGRLGQPNPSWNHLQVPSYIPRQPQLAHMSNERPIVRSPSTWHTPTPPEAIFNFMTAANHKNPMELKPHLPSFVRAPSAPPFGGGSVDLTISTSARNSLTPSPRSLHSPGLGTNISSTPPPPPLQPQEHNSIIKNSVNTINRNLSPTPGVIQTTSSVKDKIQSTSSIVTNNGDRDILGGGGLFIRDNNVKMQQRESIGVPELSSEPVELVKEAIFHSMKNHCMSLSPTRKSPPSPQSLLPPVRISLEENVDRTKTSTPPPISSPEILSPASPTNEYTNNVVNNHHHSSQLTDLLPAASSTSQIILTPGAATVPFTESYVTATLSAAVAVSTTPPPPPQTGSGGPTTTTIIHTTTNTTNKMTAPSPSNNTNTSEDSIESNLGKKRRKRKPNKTIRMSSDNESESYLNNNLEQNTITNHDNNSSSVKISLDSSSSSSNSTGDRLLEKNEGDSRLQQPDNIATELTTPAVEFPLVHNMMQPASESNPITPASVAVPLYSAPTTSIDISMNSTETVPNPTPSFPITTSINDRDVGNSDLETKKSSDIDECETIDKIAEMIANSDCNPEIILTKTKLMNNEPCCTENDLEKTLNGTICDSKTNSFEEVEYKLEEMFAGIEDDRPTKEPPLIDDKSFTGGDILSPHNMLNDTVSSGDKNEDDSMSTDKIIPKSDEDLKLDEMMTTTTTVVKTDSDKSIETGIKRSKTDDELSSAGPPQKKRRKTLTKKAKMKNSKSSTGKSTKLKDVSPKDKLNKSQSSISGAGSSTTVKDDDKNYRGPFVHVRANGEMSVINAPNNEDDPEKIQNKQKTKKPVSGQTATERNQIRGLHVSTLSMKYDADTRDTSWVCVFCKLGPHRNGLGDLFGPYILSTTCEEFQYSQVDPKEDAFKSKRARLDMIQKFVGGKRIVPNTIAPKKKKKLSAPVIHITPISITAATAAGSSSEVPPSTSEEIDIFTGMTKAGDNSYEVWLHEDCAVWAPDVHIVGSRIIGLESAVWSSSRHVCMVCSKNGAMICCLQRGCKSEAHVPCAWQRDWILNDIDFKCQCEHHQSLAL